MLRGGCGGSLPLYFFGFQDKVFMTMLFTVLTVLIFCLIAVAAIVGGHFSEKQELYVFGAVVLFLVGLYVAAFGVSVLVGVSSVPCDYELVGDNVSFGGCAVIDTDVYEQVQDVWTTSIGLLFVVVAAGLLLTWNRDRVAKRTKKRRGLDFDDE